VAITTATRTTIRITKDLPAGEAKIARDSEPA
jgi:hypothetical protein